MQFLIVVILLRKYHLPLMLHSSIKRSLHNNIHNQTKCFLRPNNGPIPEASVSFRSDILPRPFHPLLPRPNPSDLISVPDNTPTKPCLSPLQNPEYPTRFPHKRSHILARYPMAAQTKRSELPRRSNQPIHGSISPRRQQPEIDLRRDQMS